MIEKVIFAGFGGQGIMFMGRLLSQAACLEGKHTTWMPSYGAEVRGGTAHSMVIISDKEISSPVVNEPLSCVAMNGPSLKKFQEKLMPKGLMVINSSLAKSKPNRDDIKVLNLGFSQVATDLGNVKVANMVALGAYVAVKKIVSFKKLIEALKLTLPVHRRGLLSLNEKALYEGRKLIKSKRV